MQEIRRFRPSTVSRRFSVTAGFNRTCVIDGILEHSPAEHVCHPPSLRSHQPCLLVRERNMDQGVEGRHGVGACWPQVQRRHVGEINTEHLQSVAGQLTGCRYPGPAAEVNNPGTRPQQASQFRHPAGEIAS
jgi:hypothetical protein